MQKGQRINVYLAQKGYASRRGADVLVQNGEVTVNGKKALVGQLVRDTDTVTVRGKKPLSAYTYLAYHKPAGIVTNAPAPGEKDIAQSLDLDPYDNIQPVGRLDKDSSGLILLTNDTRIVGPLLSPAIPHEKEYKVSVQEVLRKDFEERMQKGVRIGSYTTKPCTVSVKGRSTFLIVLTEGKNRQIRRMCAALEYTVRSLVRVRIMHITLGNLPSNHARELTKQERTQLLEALGVT